MMDTGKTLTQEIGMELALQIREIRLKAARRHDWETEAYAERADALFRNFNEAMIAEGRFPELQI